MKLKIKMKYDKENQDDSEYSEDEYYFHDNPLNEFEEEIEKLEKIEVKLQNDVKLLWENIIIPYIENINEKQILFKLKKEDFYKFLNFMAKNNEIFKYIHNRFNTLHN